MSKGQAGSLNIPLALALLALAMASLGTWELLHRWRTLAVLQLRLDSCVGRTAADARDDLSRVGKSNQRMEAVRAAIALVPVPHLRAALDAELAAEMALQEGIRLRWDARAAGWLLRRGCDGRNDLPMPLPLFPYDRQPPDSLGPRPSRWGDPRDRELVILLRHSPRVARARVEPENGKEIGNESSWKATWGVRSNLD